MGQSLTGSELAPKVVFKTGSIYNACDSLIVTGSINGRSCDVTIDTGSNISILRPDILTIKDGPDIQPVQSCLQTVTGEKAQIHGKGELQLTIGDFTVLHPMWIADIKDECILGLDFLERHHCLVNLKESSLHVGAQEFPLRKASLKSEPTCDRAV